MKRPSFYGCAWLTFTWLAGRLSRGLSATAFGVRSFSSHYCSSHYHSYDVSSLPVVSRRDVLSEGGASAATAAATWLAARRENDDDDDNNNNNGSSAVSPTTTPTPIADLPMIRLRLPAGGFGRESLAISLKVNNAGPYDFMLDTGLTTELLSPHVAHVLGLLPSTGAAGQPVRRVQGLSAGGASTEALVELNNVSLCCGKAGDYYTLPGGPWHAVVTDFPQEHIDPAHDPVEGMIGMELLSLFDVDLDFGNNRVRFYPPGAAATVAKEAGLVAIPAVVINETGLIGIRVRRAGQTQLQQPILAFLDCGATFSVVNTAAVPYLGLPMPDPKDPVYRSGPSIEAYGVDGKSMQLPTASLAFDFCGPVVQDAVTGKPTGFAAPPSPWKPWQATRVAVGDLPAFTSVLGDGVTPYRGPAALLGLDVLAQRARVLLEAGSTASRARRVWMSPT
jgi:hypothetical protein